MEVEAPLDPVKPEQAPGANEQSMHKNHLQEYAQRSSIQLPLYQTVNEGSPHAPEFRSTVLVDGMEFRSSETFAHRKEAEQDAAKIALEGISRKIQKEGCPLIYSDMMFCKSILHEYAVKMNLERPTYTSSESEGLLPMFISSVSIDGNTYKGITGRNKKQAEQLAARAAIESILGNSNSSIGTLMSQIIKSKAKLYAAVNQVNVSNDSPEINPSSRGNVETLFEDSLLDGKQKEAALVNVTSPPVAVHTVGCALGHLSEEKQTKEDRTYALSSGLIGSGAALQHQPQACPPLQQVNTCFQTASESSDNPNFKLCGQLENETPVVDSSGLSTGTQRTSSRRKRKLYAAAHQVNVSNVAPEINPPVVDPSGLSTGTQRTSLRQKKKLSNVGKEKSTSN